MEFTTALLWYGLTSAVIVGFDIMFTYATKGFGYGFSSKREGGARTGFGLRLQRSLQNQAESAAYIIPALGAGALLGLEGQGVGIAALFIVIGRALFAPAYWTGIPFLRVPFFAMASFGAFYIYAVALLQAMGS